MKKVIIKSLGLFLFIVGIISCDKENLKEEIENNSNESEINYTRTQEGGDCYKKAIIYNGYIDCTKEGTNCKVECGDTESSGLQGYLSNLNSSENNTTSLKEYLADLTYIPQDIKNNIQTASILNLVITTYNGTIVYAVFDSNNNLLYAFSFNA